MTEAHEMLTGTEERALGYIFAFGPKTPAQLSAHIGVSHGYMQRIVKGLVEEGYLTEHDDTRYELVRS